VRGFIRRYRFELAIVAALCLAGAGIHAANLELEGWVVEDKLAGRVGPLPDGKVVRVLSLGFERLVADLFWLRTVYYVGDERSHAAGYPDVARLAEVVTDIDPYFRTAYATLYGAISALSGDPDAAIRLLEKGVRYVRYWRLHFYLGFSYYWDRLDYARAAEHMHRAVELGGGPPYLKYLASRLYSQAGDTETALGFIRARLQEAETQEEREALQKRIWDLWINRDLRRINEAVRSYRADHGTGPPDIPTLVAAGLLEREPTDPKGGRYTLGDDGLAATDLPYEVLKIHGMKRRQQMIREREGDTQ
jgi:tetratricopeptide (TPR) repeat protein